MLSREICTTIGVLSYVPNFFSLSDWDWWSVNLNINQKAVWNCQWNQVFGITCWLLWKWRNVRIFKTAAYIPYNRINAIKGLVVSCKAVWSPSSLSLTPLSNERTIVWVPPPHSWVKLNVDGACDITSGAICAGGLLCDHLGAWKVGFVYNIGEGNPLLAKIWAVPSGLRMVVSKGLANVILESDSLELVKLLNNLNDIPLEHHAFVLLYQIIQLRKDFDRLLFVHCCREANQSADHLAHLAHTLPQGITYLDQPPHGLLFLLSLDCNRSNRGIVSAVAVTNSSSSAL